MKRKWYILFSLVFIFLGSGCGSGSGTPNPNSAATSALAAQNAAALGSFGLSPQVSQIILPSIQGLAYAGIQLIPTNIGNGVVQISANITAAYPGIGQAAPYIANFANAVNQAQYYIASQIDMVELAQLQNTVTYLENLSH